MNVENKMITELLEETANNFPSKTAFIEHGTGRIFSYSELMHLVSKLSNILKQRITYPEIIVSGEETPLVAILTERSLVSVVSILATLKAGAAYVPVDPSFPPDRQEHIFSHSKCQLAIVDCSNKHRLTGVCSVVPTVILLNNETIEVEELNQTRPASNIPTGTESRNASLESLAYVLYTSGSTGKPKGVMVKHKGLLNVVNYFAALLEIGPGDRVLCLTTLCFDISMLELFMPLVTGATLVMVTAVTQKNPLLIINCLKDYEITVMQATPTTYEMLLACGWEGASNIRFLVGGEACRPKIAAMTPHCQVLYNVYGPTETSIWSSVYKLPVDAAALGFNIPVGKPISKTDFYVVDKNGKDVSMAGEEGELWIGGDGVALGYLHAPDLTAARFLKNPFGSGNIYRTGDLFRRLEDGNFLFVRRLDDQVKVNGYRIELAEVEFAIAQHDAVEQAVVIVKDNALWGFVKLYQDRTPTEWEKNRQLMNQTLQNYCRKVLPPYMTPKFITDVLEFPHTANGKLDRLSLSKLLSVNSVDNQMVEEKADNEISIRTSNIKCSISTTNTTSIANTMTNYVKDLVLKLSGQRPPLSASFAAVGIDSMAAMMFRNVLSQNLGISIDPEVLYDSNTTIQSFAIDLFHRLQQENPKVLQQYHILEAIDHEEEGETDLNALEQGIMKKDSKNAKEDKEDHSLGRQMLLKRHFIEGLRGVCIILVLIDHFFWTNLVGGKRIQCDTVLFLMITGFTCMLSDLNQWEIIQNASPKGSFSWNPWSFLSSRFFGLFPMYWICLILSILPLYLLYPTYHLSTVEFVGVILLYVTGLQTWTPYSHDAMRYSYFISLLWNVFLVYTFCKTTILTEKFVRWQKGLLLLSCLGFLIGMYLYNPNQGFMPPIGCGYFALGAVTAILFGWIQKRFSNPTVIAKWKEYCVIEHNNTNSTTSNRILVWKHFPSILLDLFAFLFFFSIFYTNTDESAVEKSLSSTTEHYHRRAYWRYDTFMELVGIPLLFSLILLWGFLQPQHYEYSIFGTIITRTKGFVFLGECSLAIYLFNQLIVNDYWYWGISGIQANQFPFQRHFILHEINPNPRSMSPGIYWAGIFLMLIFAIFMQKIVQDRWITSWQLQWSHHRNQLKDEPQLEQKSRPHRQQIQPEDSVHSKTSM